MLELAILLRMLYMYKHNCHQTVGRICFFQDHEFLSKSYNATLEQYDSIIERMIGNDLNPNLNHIQLQAAQQLQQYNFNSNENKECFNNILSINKNIINKIEIICKDQQITQGTMQLVGDISNLLEKENYQLKQRIKK